jgi:hypothetical protein
MLGPAARTRWRNADRRRRADVRRVKDGLGSSVTMPVVIVRPYG